jgi:hypothetical protein
MRQYFLFDLNREIRIADAQITDYHSLTGHLFISDPSLEYVLNFLGQVHTMHFLAVV